MVNQQVTKQCERCSSNFKVSPSRSKSARYCSRPCHYTHRKGISLSPKTQFKKGDPPPRTAYVKNDPRITGSNHYLWKPLPSYNAVHKWLKENWGKPTKCENQLCVYPRYVDNGRKLLKKPARYEWANIARTTERKKENYVQLCPSCHRSFDQKGKSIKIDGQIIISSNFVK
jgi:hypothetical protein